MITSIIITMIMNHDDHDGLVQQRRPPPDPVAEGDGCRGGGDQGSESQGRDTRTLTMRTIMMEMTMMDNDHENNDLDYRQQCITGDRSRGRKQRCPSAQKCF